jgi:hypothetical protein
VKLNRRGTSAKLYWSDKKTSTNDINKNVVFRDDSVFYNKNLFESSDYKKLDINKVLYSVTQEEVDAQIGGVTPVLKETVQLFFFGKLQAKLFESLTQFEQEMIKALMYFKDHKSQDKKVDPEWIFFPKCRRRTEENIKFIFNRAIKYMMKTFEKEMFAQVKSQLRSKYQNIPKKHQLAYAFFGFYFGREAEKLGKDMSFFLLPKKPSMESVRPKSHFTSISRQYLQLVSVNPHFLGDVRFYLTNIFMREILRDSVKKVQIILNKCKAVNNSKSKSVSGEGDCADFMSYVDVIKKTHMPWGLPEIKVALEDLMKYMRL